MDIIDSCSVLAIWHSCRSVAAKHLLWVAVIFKKGRYGMAAKRYFWFKCFPQLFLSSTDCQLMKPEEFGVFCWFLFHSWEQPEQCYLPNNEQYLQRLSRLPADQWERYKDNILSKFEITDDGNFLFNRKLLSVYEELIEERNTRSESGKAGANKRWGSSRAKGDNSGAIAVPSAAIKNNSKKTKSSARKKTKSSTKHTKNTDKTGGGVAPNSNTGNDIIAPPKQCHSGAIDSQWQTDGKLKLKLNNNTSSVKVNNITMRTRARQDGNDGDVIHSGFDKDQIIEWYSMHHQEQTGSPVKRIGLDRLNKLLDEFGIYAAVSIGASLKQRDVNVNGIEERTRSWAEAGGIPQNVQCVEGFPVELDVQGKSGRSMYRECREVYDLCHFVMGDLPRSQTGRGKSDAWDRANELASKALEINKIKDKARVKQALDMLLPQVGEFIEQTNELVRYDASLLKQHTITLCIKFYEKSKAEASKTS